MSAFKRGCSNPFEELTVDGLTGLHYVLSKQYGSHWQGSELLAAVLLELHRRGVLLLALDESKREEYSK